MRTVLNQMNYQYSYFSSYDWLHLKFTGDTPGFSSVSPTTKTVVQKWSYIQKICAMSWNEWTINFLIFSIFSLEYSRFCTEIEKNIYVRGARPLFFVGGSAVWPPSPPPLSQDPDSLRLNHPSQLVLGYHWLTFLN